MAQEQGSFLYRLKLMLDGDQAVQSLGLKMENVKKQVREMGTATGQANAKVEQMVNSFEAAPRAMQPLTREVQQSEESLAEMAAQADRSFGRITSGTLEVADGAQRMSKSLVRGYEQAEQGAKQLASAQTRVRGTTFSLGSTASSTASQLSIDLTQSAQDAAFGLENLAASAPFLQEQFGRLRRESGSFTGALSGLASAFMGPTGVIAAFTLVLTFKDEIIGLFQSLINSATEATSQLEKFGNVLDEEIRGFTDQEEMVSLFSGLEQGTENFTEAQGILQEALNSNVNAINTFETAITSAIQGISSYDEAVEKLDRHQLDRIVRSGFQDVPSINNFPEFQKRLEELRAQQEGLADAMNAMNIESLEQMTLTNRLQKNYPLTRKEAKRLASILLEQKEAQEEANEASEKAAEYLKRLRNLRVEAMEEGISKQINAINASIMAREKEIRQLDLAAEKQERLLNLLDRVAERKKEAALEEFSTVDLELQEGEEITAAMDRINSKIDQRIQKVRNLKGEYSDLSEQQQEQTVQELEQEREQEISDVLDKSIFINGRLVRRETFLQRQKKQWKRTQKELKAEREEFRIRQEAGEISGFFDQLGAAQIQHQLDMIEREEELLKKRVQQQLAYLRTIQMAYAPGSEEYKNIQNRIESAQQNLANIEARMRQRRISQQEKFLRQMVDNIESTPLGDAYANMFTQVGSVIQSFRETDWAAKNMKERAQMISSAGSVVTGAMANVAEASYSAWQSRREQDLKEQGKTEEQRRKIIKEEGKRRFQIMQGIKLASAIVSGLEAQVHAWTKGMAAGGPPLAIAMSAASAAKTAFMIQKIASMSIGDRLGGGAGGGVSSRGGQFTQRAAAGSATAASRTGTMMQQSRNNNEDQIKKTAERVGKEVADQMPESVTMDTDTAEKANDAANNQQTKLNK